MNAGPRGRLMVLLTSVPLAALQLGLLAVLAALWTPALKGVLLGLGVLLCACTLTTAWTRAPYDRARLGFLLTHLGPVLVILGYLTHPWVAALGLASLVLGIPWMFYLKPILKPKKDKTPPPAWQRFTLQGTRILFLAFGAALMPAALGRAPMPVWALVSWLTLAVALHLHHVKTWKGAKAQLAGLVGWALAVTAYLRLR